MEVKLLNKKIKIKTIIIVLIGCLTLITTILIINFLLKNNNNEKTCSVTFDSNGGNKIAAKEVNCGTKISPVVPEKVGFVFKGWLFNGQGVNLNEFVINDNIILKANWQKEENVETVIVSFDSDGGSEVASIEVAKGTSTSEPVAPTKKGYFFAGWYFNNELFDFTFTFNESMTLKAKWEKTNNSSNLNQNKPNSNQNVVNDDPDLAKTVNDILGLWYYEEDPSVYFNFSYSYYLSKKIFAINWDNFDIEKGKMYPTEGYMGAQNFELPLNESFLFWLKEYKFSLINAKELTVGKYKFTRTKKEIDLSIYDKYLGTWYLKNDSKSYIKITKEYDPSGMGPFYRIDIIAKENGEYKSLDYPAQGISYKEINEKNTIFDRFNLKIENGNLIYKNQIYVKNKKDSVIPIDYFSVLVDKNIIEVGEQAHFSIKYYPEDANDVEGTWRVEDPQVASIDQNGVLTGKKNGYIKVFFKTKSGKEEFNYIGINDATAKGIKLLEKNIELSPNHSYDLKYELIPSYAVASDISWSSNNPDVALVDERGCVSSKKEGTAVITVTVKVDNKSYTDSCTVNVKRIMPTSIKLDKVKENIKYHNTTTLKAIVEPDDAYNKEVIWSTSDDSIASVNSYGVVTGNGEGTATITATTKDGELSASCEVTVTFVPLKGYATGGLELAIDGRIQYNVYAEVTAIGNYPESSKSYFYTIKLYKEDKFLKEISNSLTNKIYVPISDISGSYFGTYKVEYIIRDIDNNEYKGVYEFTISN